MLLHPGVIFMDLGTFGHPFGGISVRFASPRATFWWHLMAFAPGLGLVSMTSLPFLDIDVRKCILQQIIGCWIENEAEVVLPIGRRSFKNAYF